jgi:tRNA nucleotidyltransferase (CCA-adding enzyme)
MGEFETVLGAVRERVAPSEAEREALEAAISELRERAERATDDVPPETDVVLAGSTARDTWLAGDRDIDIFVRFPPELGREQLETHGLAVGHETLPEGREEFAEHPYVVGELDGFQVDIVPCYRVAEATEIRSAVDRTPFHTEYVSDRLTPETAASVRVCKQFFTAIGVYGSNLRTRGFSGFLTELLVLEHGDFRALVEAVADWRPPVRLDPEDHGTATFDDPLVVIDPTDPGRNVAAVLSAANLARLQHCARALLADPREDLFVAPERAPLAASEIRERFDDRGTTPVALCFETPDIVDDQLWPQLERSLDGISGTLDRHGFDVLRADAFAGDETVLLFELAVAERPRVERHEGPPVAVRDHARSFYEAYEDTPAYGPFVAGDRYVVERPREVTTATALLDDVPTMDVALGTHVESALEAEFRLLVGPEIATLADAFGEAFARYLDPGVRNV